MSASGDYEAARTPPPARAPIWDPLVRELDEKDKVIAQLARALAQTRDHLGLARSALESIANEARDDVRRDRDTRLCEMAVNMLKRIHDDKTLTAAFSNWSAGGC
jgi:uncharacterized membrane protein YccC